MVERHQERIKDNPQKMRTRGALVEHPFGTLKHCAGINHFMLPDTLGIMSPDEVFTSLSDMCQHYPALQFDFHPHNDYGLATANVMAAVQAGVNSIHCTINCLGERAGNASLAQVVVVLRDKMNKELSINDVAAA